MKTAELHDKIFNTVTSNGMREMTLFRFREAIGMLWTSPCDCNPDEKTGETLCCNLCGKPTARTESKELPGKEQKTRFLHLMYEIVGSKTTKEVRDKVNIILSMYDDAIASPLLASRDARIEEITKEITRLQEKYDEDGYDFLPIIKLRRMGQYIDASFQIYINELASKEARIRELEEELERLVSIIENGIDAEEDKFLGDCGS